MKLIQLTDREIKVPNSWDDITLSKYIQVAKLEETKSSYSFEELYLMKLFEVLCDVEEGDLDSLTLDQVEEVSKELLFLSKQDGFKIKTHINIDDVDYVFPTDLNKLTMGEYISIKTLQERFTNQVDAMPYILAIILRPGKKVEDPYTKKERWVQNKFDVEGMEWRKDLFMNQPVTDLIGSINFFLSGKQIFTNNIEDSTIKEPKLTPSDLEVLP